MDRCFNFSEYMPRNGISGSSCFIFEELPDCFPKWPSHFTSQLTVYENSNFSMISPTLVTIWYFYYDPTWGRKSKCIPRCKNTGNNWTRKQNLLRQGKSIKRIRERVLQSRWRKKKAVDVRCVILMQWTAEKCKTHAASLQFPIWSRWYSQQHSSGFIDLFYREPSHVVPHLIQHHKSYVEGQRVFPICKGIRAAKTHWLAPRNRATKIKRKEKEVNRTGFGSTTFYLTSQLLASSFLMVPTLSLMAQKSMQRQEKAEVNLGYGWSN